MKLKLDILQNANFLYSTEMGRDILLLNKPENRNKEMTTRFGINGKQGIRKIVL